MSSSRALALLYMHGGHQIWSAEPYEDVRRRVEAGRELGGFKIGDEVGDITMNPQGVTLVEVKVWLGIEGDEDPTRVRASINPMDVALIYELPATMNVYVLMEYEPHEGGNVIEVYATELDANTALQRRQITHSWENYEVQEWAVVSGVPPLTDAELARIAQRLARSHAAQGPFMIGSTGIIIHAENDG